MRIENLEFGIFDSSGAITVPQTVNTDAQMNDAVNSREI